MKREDVAPNILLFLMRERASSSPPSSSLDVDPDPDANDHASSLPLIHPSILSTKCILPSLSSFVSKSSLPLLLLLLGVLLVDTTSLFKLHPIRFRLFAMVAMPCLRSDRIVSARFPRKTAKRRATTAEPTTTIRQKKNGTADFCAVVVGPSLGKLLRRRGITSSSSSSSAPRNNNAVLTLRRRSRKARRERRDVVEGHHHTTRGCVAVLRSEDVFRRKRPKGRRSVERV